MQAAQYAAAETDARLTEMASRQGALDAELVQLDEALTAADTAQRALGEAARELGSAGDWTTYDTFLGGGVFADLAKHHRLDRAGALMRHADAALRHLAAELADVQVAAVGEVGVPELTRTLDIWFDNIFSDWAVRDRIRRRPPGCTTSAPPWTPWVTSWRAAGRGCRPPKPSWPLAGDPCSPPALCPSLHPQAERGSRPSLSWRYRRPASSRERCDA
ncbi:hypothetical protein [Nocardioides houyundeii]|uniref:hypothetical protein n=1 Tax=Nocardioides houyundeii TaxID=2045452 RepID=UPI000C76519F|nr:hypothetical protein [Nocardioides houyundeii]